MNTADIEQMNSQEQSPQSESRSSEASGISDAAQDAKGQDSFVMKTLKNPPSGGVIAGGLVLGAAAAFGVIETAVAAGAAYVVYRLLRKNSSQNEAQAKNEGQQQSAWGQGDSDGQSRSSQA
jgi:hypothetical protein